MAHPTHPHLRELADRHKRRKKGGCHVYRAPNGVEAIVAGDTVHAARPGQPPRTAHRASLAHQSIGDLARKLTSGSAAALPGHAYPVGARVQVFHVNRGEWGAPTVVTQHKAWRGSPGYHVADRVVWVPESHVRRARGATQGTATARPARRRRAPQTLAEARRAESSARSAERKAASAYEEARDSGAADVLERREDLFAATEARRVAEKQLRRMREKPR